MVDSHTLSNLVRLTYAAAIDRHQWNQYVDALSEISGGIRPHLFCYDPDLAANQRLRFYRSHAAAGDDTAAQLELSFITPAAPLYRQGQAIAYEVAAAADSLPLFGANQQRALGGDGIVLHTQGRRFVVLGGLRRRHESDQLGRQWIDLVAHLAPHMLQAFEIARLVSEQGLERLALAANGGREMAALFVVDQTPRLIYASKAGLSLLRTGAILREDQRRRLHFSDPRADSWFQLGLRQTAQPGLARDYLASHGATTDPVRAYQLARFTPDRLQSPLGLLLGYGSTYHMVTVSAPQVQPDIGRRLGQQYQLTPREVAVAMQLYEGGSVLDIATTSGVSIHTVRNQVRSIMEKLAVGRQKDIVRIVAGLLSSAPMS